MAIKINKAGKLVSLASEDEIQMEVIRWRDEVGIHRWPELKWLHHIPNGGLLAGRSKLEIMRAGAKRKALGVVAGIPDLCLPVCNGQFSGLYIELKTLGGSVSDKQFEFSEFALSQGYEWLALRSAEAAVYEIESYMGKIGL